MPILAHNETLISLKKQVIMLMEYISYIIIISALLIALLYYG